MNDDFNLNSEIRSWPHLTLREAAYTLTALYEVFYKIVTGKLGAILGITTRKAKVKGNVAKMLKHTAGTNKLVEIMKTIPTSFEGGFA